MKIQMVGNQHGQYAYVSSGIAYEVNLERNLCQYRINYAVDAAWCNFHLDKMDRDVIKTVKLWQETTNKLTGWKCF